MNEKQTQSTDKLFIHWLVKRWWFWTVFCLFFFSYPIYRSIYRELPPPPPVLITLPDYELTDENGEVFTPAQLQGRVSILHFHFLNCPSICPGLMEKMQKIQKRVRGVGQKIFLLSVTVDPENDNVDRLFQHARKMKANPYIWKFLTADPSHLIPLITEGFKTFVSEKEYMSEDVYDIVHSGQFYLIDQDNNIRGIFSDDDNSINQMMIEAGLMINRMENQIASNE